jgi:hypothetical protein
MKQEDIKDDFIIDDFSIIANEVEEKEKITQS